MEALYGLLLLLLLLQVVTHGYEVSEDAALVGQGTWVALAEGIRQVLVRRLHRCNSTSRPGGSVDLTGNAASV
jgi:hypothetical protein